MLKLQVQTYDVWCNEDSWFVNDSWTVGTIEVLDDKAETILQALIEGKYLIETCTLEDVAIKWWDEGFCEVEQTEDGYPLYGLKVVQED